MRIYTGTGAVFSPLNGKTILGLGDSFMKGHTLDTGLAWIDVLGARNNMTVHNLGVNGAPLAYKSTAEYTPLIDEIDDKIASVPSADYVVLIGGHNDARLNITVGTEDDTGRETFYGAINTIASKLITAYPSAHILWLSPFKRLPTHSEKAYRDAMEVASGKQMFAFYDCFQRSGINLYQSNSPQCDLYELGNTLHMNAAGHERFSYLVENLLEQMGD